MSRALLLLLPVAFAAATTSAIGAANPENAFVPSGRVSVVEGRMSMRMTGGQTWTDAAANFPVAADTEFKTASGTHAELQLGGTAVAIDDDTAVAVETLDDETTMLFVQGGSIDVRVRALTPGERVIIETPESRARLQDVGTYRVTVSGDAAVTQVMSFDGRAQIETLDGHQTLAAGEGLEIDDDRRVTALHVGMKPLEDWTAEPGKKISGPCVRKEEASAITLRHLQSELMVAALSCNQRAAYNSFVLRFQPQLADGGHMLRTYFDRIGGGESALNTYVTDAANAAGLRRADDPQGFCRKASQVFSDLEQAPEKLLTLAEAGFTVAGGVPRACTAEASMKSGTLQAMSTP